MQFRDWKEELPCSSGEAGMCKSNKFGIVGWTGNTHEHDDKVATEDGNRGPGLVISALLPNSKIHITSVLVLPCYMHAAFQLLCRTWSCLISDVIAPRTELFETANHLWLMFPSKTNFFWCGLKRFFIYFNVFFYVSFAGVTGYIRIQISYFPMYDFPIR